MAPRKGSRKKSSKGNQESDAGDVAKKFMNGLGSIHNVGGVGLVLIAIGGVILFFLVIMNATSNLLPTGVSLFLILLGAYIKLKEMGLIKSK